MLTRKVLLTVGLCTLAFAYVDARGDETVTTNGDTITTVTVEQAARVARMHLRNHNPGDRFTLSAAHPITSLNNARSLGYRFDLSPRGYIIVAGDTTLPPVVAYSFTSPAGLSWDTGSPLVNLIHHDLRSRLDHAHVLPDTVTQRRANEWNRYLSGAIEAPNNRGVQYWPPLATTPTGGWLEENWHQGSPYNALCPLDSGSGQHCIAGCPSIAMGMILDYHARLHGTTLDDSDDYYHNYQGNRFWIDDDYAAHGFASFPQLNAHLKSMFDDYFHGREPSNTEKAALIFGCGVAAEQVYSASMSGTFGIDQAHEGLQRFGCGTADLRYPHHTDLFSRMKGNVMNACPVLFACLVATGPGGHNMVVDGYNSDDYYHVNFGWGGGYNGWYLLPSELPYNLTIIEGAIVDIATNECDPMDCNCDRRVDSDDLRYMLPCLTGPMGPSYAPGCDSFDTDADLDTDLADFSLFQTTYATTT